jgi:hypothetical protein
MWNAFVGAIIGAIAVALVGSGFAVVTHTGGYLLGLSVQRTANLVLDSLHVTLKPGSTSNQIDYNAKCLEHEVIVGGQCIIESGEGTLQNEGTTNAGYFCTYSRRADPTGVKGKIYAACLGLNLNYAPQPN